MKNSENIKKIVKDKYAKIADFENDGCCCCCGGEPTDTTTVFSEDYKGKEGYVEDADMGLGCGIPTDFAGMNEGDKVLDLGSGAGNDCFVARSIVGETGQVTGLDFTDEMIEKANINKEKMAYTNINFVKGDIENMPFDSNNFDVIISNCVLNLVPDKSKAFAEMYRVLKDGAHFCISDVILQGELPLKIKLAGEMYAGCVSGALQKDEYLEIIEKCGFSSVDIHKEKMIDVPDNILLNYISQDDLTAFKKSGTGIYSITISAKK